ncbi:unnamed protein product [Paramecium octaurelia]|uniref:EF-hand domain-containing protein n=1 Tax=Paramecium octaurelia TaxID=43137 RepID=A0A8S1W1A8_PAROT|nr:unnamed protein product [Paramecium octaurelia]
MKKDKRSDKKKTSQASLYRSSITITDIPDNLMEKNDILAEEIQKTVKTLTYSQRIAKAERHIYDAYYLRTIRNDIDETNKKFLKILWIIENQQFWIQFQFLLTLIYQLMTFFESSATDGLEGFILAFFGLDTVITVILLKSKKKGGIGFKFNLKRQLKIFFFCVCLLDFFVHLGDPTIVRFSRLLRAFLMPLYSKDLRRTLKGILKASRDLFLLIVLYLFIISIFSFVGINLIGELDNVDKTTQDYGNFLKLFSMLLMTATLDFYPDILIPPMMQGTYYALFFIIYLLLFIFLFAPIPLAVVYEGFRNHRMEIAISDIIKQKSAMMASFISLDFEDQGYISEVQFKDFIRGFYRNQLSENKLLQLFGEIDKDFNDKVQFDEFYQLLKVLQDGTRFNLPSAKPLECWERLRAFVNQRGLQRFIEGSFFSTSMLVVTITNCILIIAAFFIEDLSVLDIFNSLDTIFLVLYSMECLVKIVALGIRDYFNEGWNVFDISLVILQIVFDYILFKVVTGNIVQSIKANRILRLAKIQKVFRLFRAFRSVKIISFLLKGVEFLDVVRRLLYKILFCIPIIFRLMMPVQMVFFIYATIGIYVYGEVETVADNPYANSKCDPNQFQYSWGDCKYADFKSFAGAYLMMLQFFIAAEWNQVVFELTYDTGNMFSAMVFIGSFEFLSIFLLALISGLVWEVFTIVSLSIKQEDEQIEDEIEISNEAQLDTKINGISGVTQLKKKTRILNDDNPDVIQFQSNDKRDLKEGNPAFRTISEQFQQDTFNENNLQTRENSQVRIVQIAHSKTLIRIKTPEYKPFDVGALYKQHFKDYQTFLEFKQSNDGFDVQHVTTEYMNHLRNEIKKDEIFHKKYINISNHHLLIQNAVLRDASEVYIKKQEDDFFKTSYREKFERIQELKFQSKFKIESKILFSLMGILKFPKPNIKYYFQILYLIENYFTYQLLPESSFFKLLHQINNKWYLISIEDTQICFNRLHSGPWDHSDTLFTTSNLQICENLRSFIDQDTYESRTTVEDFKLSLSKLAKNFEMDISSVDVNSSCILYQITNDQYGYDTNSIKLRRNQDEISPDQKFVVLESQRNIGTKTCFTHRQDSQSPDEHQHINKTIMFVLSKTQAQEQRIIYQNQVMLAQFILDLAGVIHNYSHNFFQQIEDLYTLRLKQKGKGIKRM